MTNNESKKFKKKVIPLGGSLAISIPSLTCELNNIKEGDIVIAEILDVIKSKEATDHD